MRNNPLADYSLPTAYIAKLRGGPLRAVCYKINIFNNFIKSIDIKINIQADMKISMKIHLNFKYT